MQKITVGMIFLFLLVCCGPPLKRSFRQTGRDYYIELRVQDVKHNPRALTLTLKREAVAICRTMFAETVWIEALRVWKPKRRFEIVGGIVFRCEGTGSLSLR